MCLFGHTTFAMFYEPLWPYKTRKFYGPFGHKSLQCFMSPIWPYKTRKFYGPLGHKSLQCFIGNISHKKFAMHCAASWAIKVRKVCKQLKYQECIHECTEKLPRTCENGRTRANGQLDGVTACKTKWTGHATDLKIGERFPCIDQFENRRAFSLHRGRTPESKIGQHFLCATSGFNPLGDRVPSTLWATSGLVWGVLEHRGSRRRYRTTSASGDDPGRTVLATPKGKEVMSES